MTDSGYGQAYEESRRDYSRLTSITSTSRLSRLLSEDQWVEINNLLDRKVPRLRIARRLHVSLKLVNFVRGTRRCLDLYRGDPEKLAQCLKGEQEMKL
jgi:hypothetical protein